MRSFNFSISSILPIDKEKLWHAVTNMNGVNYELAPLVRMTVPKTYKGFTISDAPLNQPLFSSLILLFCYIPVDLHRFKLEKVVVNERFEEYSNTLIHRFWQHTRILTTVKKGTRIEDRLTFQPRLPLLGYFLLPIFQLVFRNRHRKLNDKYRG